MRFLTHLPAWLRNKYFIALAFFAVIMLFVDKNDLFSQREKSRDEAALRQSKEHYTQEIKKLDQTIEALSSDPRAIEKLGREEHLLKKDNEEVFLVPEKSDAAKN
jgi:cell division protein DivIC